MQQKKKGKTWYDVTWMQGGCTTNNVQELVCKGQLLCASCHCLHSMYQDMNNVWGLVVLNHCWHSKILPGLAWVTFLYYTFCTILIYVPPKRLPVGLCRCNPCQCKYSHLTWNKWLSLRSYRIYYGIGGTWITILVNSQLLRSEIEVEEQYKYTCIYVLTVSVMWDYQHYNLATSAVCTVSLILLGRHLVVQCGYQ